MELKFIDVIETNNKTLKHNQLQDQERRAHSARVSHALRRRAAIERSKKKDLNTTLIPKPVLGHGSSDPFNAAPIIIDPPTAGLFTFMRDAIIPAHNATPLVRACSPLPIDSSFNDDKLISARGIKRTWHNYASNFLDEGIALAFRSHAVNLRWLVEGTTLPRETEVELLKIRTRSAALLRHRLSINDPEYHKLAFMHCFFLFKAEVSAGDYDAAAVHGQYLRVATDRALAKGTIGVPTMCSILANDIDLTGRCMGKPILNMEKCLQYFEPFWDKLRISMTKIGMDIFKSSPDQTIDDAVDVEPLRSIFLESRLHLVVAESCSFDGNASEWDAQDLVFVYLRTTSYVSVGRLFSLYYDLRHPAAQSNYANMSVGHRFTCMSLTLALLHCILSLEHTCYVNGRNLRDLSPWIMPELHTTLTQTLVHCTKQECLKYHRAHVWVMFIGTIHENNQQIPTPPSGTSLPFSTRIRSEMHNTTISNWAEMESFASSFFYTRLLLPQGSSWIRKLLQLPLGWTRGEPTNTELGKSETYKTS